MLASHWIKTAFAGPLLLLEIAEVTGNACFVIGERSRRFIANAGRPGARERREAKLMVREKIEGGKESLAAGLQFIAVALRTKSRPDSSMSRYFDKSIRTLLASRNAVQFSARLLLINVKIACLLIERSVRSWLFMLDLARTVSAPLKRRVVANAVRLAK